MSHAPTIEIKNLIFQPSPKLPGLEIQNFSISPGNVCAIIGSSGCGKSLFLSLLSGFPPKTWESKLGASKFSYFNEEIKNFFSCRKYSAQMREANGNIFFLPQKFPDSAGGSVQQNLYEIVNALLQKKEPCKKIFEKAKKLDFFDWDEKFNVPIKKLSGGERKRFEIAARIIAADLSSSNEKPNIFLMDEPTAGLDLKNTKEIFKIIKACSNHPNTAIIFSTHELSHWDGNVDSLLYLFKDKKLNITKSIFWGNVEDFLQQGNSQQISDAFLSFNERTF